MEAKWRWVLITAVAPIAWGSSYYVTKHFLPADAPLWGSALRALPAGLLLLLLARRLPRGSWWMKALLLGILNFGAFFVLVYVAAQLLPSSTATAVMALSPLALTGFAWPLLGQTPTLRILLAAALGIVGVALVVSLGVTGANPWGIAASLTAIVISSFGSLLATRWRDELPLLATTSWQMIAGGGMLLIAAIAIEGAPPVFTGERIAAYAYMTVIATALAFLCWFAGLAHIPAGTAGVVGLLNPVTGILMGVLLAGEVLTLWQCAGIALVLLAIGIGQSRSRRSRASLALAAP